ncbi:DUF1127 domain-containing protein [Xanthobacter agilis]|uniref:DUF1127 domain-containing protein n=1 Tax=Xanthobacter agilis TaxID=47492 RepID=UPI00372984F7
MSMSGETRRLVVAPVAEALASLLMMTVAAAFGAKRRADALGHMLERRRAMAALATLDDHMLKDIGITRADVRDAVSAPLGADPTRLLVLRVSERRAARQLARRELGLG